MFDSFRLPQVLQTAGFKNGAVHVADADSVVIRLLGINDNQAEMDRLANVVPLIEACGLKVDGYCTGMTSSHDSEVGGSIFARRVA